MTCISQFFKIMPVDGRNIFLRPDSADMVSPHSQRARKRTAMVATATWWSRKVLQKTALTGSFFRPPRSYESSSWVPVRGLVSIWICTYLYTRSSDIPDVRMLQKKAHFSWTIPWTKTKNNLRIKNTQWMSLMVFVPVIPNKITFAGGTRHIKKFVSRAIILSWKNDGKKWSKSVPC